MVRPLQVLRVASLIDAWQDKFNRVGARRSHKKTRPPSPSRTRARGVGLSPSQNSKYSPWAHYPRRGGGRILIKLMSSVPNRRHKSSVSQPQARLSACILLFFMTAIQGHKRGDRPQPSVPLPPPGVRLMRRSANTMTETITTTEGCIMGTRPALRTTFS